MIEKIRKAAFEGVLISKAIHFLYITIIGLPRKVIRSADWILGNIVRAFFAVRIKTNERQIMFIPFQGDYTCNLKYIAEELRRRGVSLQYDIVFSARKAAFNNPESFPNEFRLVEQYSAKYYQEIARSKLLIANSVEFLKKPTPKKRNQVWIETWHGSLGIKRFGAKDNSGKAWVSAAKRCGKAVDYIISNSSFEDKVYKDTFWKNTPILQFGHPRNDLLFSDQITKEKIRESILKKYEIISESKLILYAPTFRDSHALSAYSIDYDQLAEALSERFGGMWTVLVRLHPTVRKASMKYTSKKNVIDVTSYPDIQELMLIADVAITDYSSWIYDYILTLKPGFIFATDKQSYVTERGFYYPLEETPFSLAVNNNQLIQNILNFNQNEYQLKVQNFLSEKGCVDDGKASQRTADKILEVMSG